MSDERRGVVELPLGDRTIPLRFTWRAIDQLGRVGVIETLDVAASGKPGDMEALARLIVVASDGQVREQELLDGFGLPAAEAYLAVLKAWALASRRPSGVERAVNPLIRLWTSLKTLWRRLSRSV